MVGAVAGNRLGAIRDAKGKSVAAVFAQLGGNQKAEVGVICTRAALAFSLLYRSSGLWPSRSWALLSNLLLAHIVVLYSLLFPYLSGMLGLWDSLWHADTYY